MALVIPSFVHDIESNMRAITEHHYDRLNKETWWRLVAKEMPLSAKKEMLVWLLDTAGIDYVNRLGGEVEFSGMMAQTHSVSYKAATAGLKLNRYQMSDVVNGLPGGAAVDAAAHWARGIAAYSAYWPQKQVAKAINDGDQSASLAYDGIVFFKDNTASHPVNPFDSSLGTFANMFTGAASGSYPGALPIGGATTLDVALENVGKALAYIAGIKMPNGSDPRMLRARRIIAPPALTTRVQQLTNAKYIAQAAASGGGSGDVEAVIRNWGLLEPIEAVELGAGFTNGSDSSWYIAVEDVTTNELGAIVYGNREPFEVQYHDGVSDADLQRANELEWTVRGANTVAYGHPYLLFKCKAT